MIMTDKQKLIGIKKALRSLRSYPQKGKPRRTKNGYPSEIVYDQFAYERMVRSFRSAITNILSEFK